MGRRRQSPLKTLFDLAMLLPPWLAVVVAAVSYVLLHLLSQQVVDPSTNMQLAGHFVVRSLGKTMAGFFQYIIPSVFLLAATASFFKRRKRAQLTEGVRARSNSGALLQMGWEEFEQLVSQHFREHGFDVRETGGGGADGGVDLELLKDNELFLVQCKQWRAQKVGVEIVRELYGVMAARGAVGGFVVTSGQFTAEAIRFAEGRNITLIAGEELVSRITRGSALTNHKDTISSTAPPCPVCGSLMVERTARRGSNTGQDFWGCGNYPNCRGTLPR